MRSTNVNLQKRSLTGAGNEQGRGKKEAKQAAAAAVLETLLANVPLEDFLHRPIKQQQKRAQVGIRLSQCHASSL